MLQGLNRVKWMDKSFASGAKVYMAKHTTTAYTQHTHLHMFINTFCVHPKVFPSNKNAITHTHNFVAITIATYDVVYRCYRIKSQAHEQKDSGKDKELTFSTVTYTTSHTLLYFSVFKMRTIVQFSSTFTLSFASFGPPPSLKKLFCSA